MTDHRPTPRYATPSAIVVMEDDRDARREYLLENLRTHGFNAKGAATAAELYRIMLSQRFDVVVLDATLRDEDGFAVGRHLRSIPNIGIVMLTAPDERKQKLEALKSGADLYLAKPVDPDMLVAALQNLINRLDDGQNKRHAGVHETSSARWRLEAGGWRLVSPRGMAITLTKIEQCVVTTLAAAGKTPVTRETLVRALARCTHDCDTHRIEMMIHRLRRKALITTGEALSLVTIRRSGYLFTCDKDPSVALSP
jgi:two-component system, OmpR family, response regulator PhoP